MTTAPHVEHDNCPTCEVVEEVSRVLASAGDEFRMYLMHLRQTVGDGYINVRVEVEHGMPSLVYVNGRRFRMRHNRG